MLHCLFVKRVFTIVVKPLLLNHCCYRVVTCS